MTFYAVKHLEGTKYRIEAREDTLLGIYDGYYNARLHEFSLYRRSVSDNIPSGKLPWKLKVSAYEVRAVWASETKEDGAEERRVKSEKSSRSLSELTDRKVKSGGGDTTSVFEQLKINI